MSVMNATKVHNFSAGPAILPEEVLAEAIEGLKDYRGTGIPVISMSHRSKQWEETMHEAEALTKELLQIGDDYGVVFLQGGASMQFTMVPMNLLPEGGKAAYTKTGTWASNAIKEGKLFGNIEVIASSEDKNFNYIPKGYVIPEDAAYFHYTSNNTIFGTQVHEVPNSPVPMVCDMSSDMFSRPVDGNKFGLIYAGAQKNLGPAGATIVAVKKSLIGQSGRKLPSMLDYGVAVDKESMFNTPPVFAIYVSYLTMRWIKSIGGLEEMAKRNTEKAQLLYSEIDRNPLFKGTTAVEDRSEMNACFVMEDASLEPEFLKFTEQHGIDGIKGHRSVGGFRASIYNALPKESVQVLVDCMQEFASKRA